jgi:hypothetical protein
LSRKRQDRISKVIYSTLIKEEDRRQYQKLISRKTTGRNIEGIYSFQGRGQEDISKGILINFPIILRKSHVKLT